MLIVIISLLPIKYRARTAALSRRWRTLWLRTPIDLLDAHKLCHGYRQSLDAFSQILGSHDGPIKGLITGKFRSNGRERGKLDEWFRSRAIDQLEKLSYNDGQLAANVRAPLRAQAAPHQVYELPFPALITRPLFFYHDRSTSSSSPSASQRMTWSTCSAAVLHSSSFVFRR